MAVADNRQRYMPFPDDRSTGRCQPLGYPEAVLLVNPMDQRLTGEVLLACPFSSLCSSSRPFSLLAAVSTFQLDC